MKVFYNSLLFIGLIIVVIFLFRSFNYSPMLIEGMTDGSGNSVSAPANGIAGNAASYGASLKATTIKLQDTFLISKYRSDYETAILNLDDFLSNNMLNVALNVDMTNPMIAVDQLAQMQQAKTALNTVMKFIDSQ